MENSGWRSGGVVLLVEESGGWIEGVLSGGGEWWSGSGEWWSGGGEWWSGGGEVVTVQREGKTTKFMQGHWSTCPNNEASFNHGMLHEVIEVRCTCTHTHAYTCIKTYIYIYLYIYTYRVVPKKDTYIKLVSPNSLRNLQL